MSKNKIKQIQKKKNKIPIACLTAYSKNIAQIADKHCDIILVGDSLGMVLFGMKSTREVKLETMIVHAKAVKKAARRSLVICDMPYRTYTNKYLAYQNAKKIIKTSNCDGVKLEGGKKVVSIIKYLTSRGIQVMGHIGLLPQTDTKFKVKGKKINEENKIYNDAIAISNSGAFSIILECIVENLAKRITKKISIPTIGIGASKYCDGQILVTEDILGLSAISPKFVKQYKNLSVDIEKCIKKYVKEVKVKKFPNFKNAYK
jgi:3-methyl-2-oxobutanoate hydroxymethyltransferase